MQPVIRRQRRGRVHRVWLDDANFANEEGAMGKRHGTRSKEEREGGREEMTKTTKSKERERVMMRKR